MTYTSTRRPPSAAPRSPRRRSWSTSRPRRYDYDAKGIGVHLRRRTVVGHRVRQGPECKLAVTVHQPQRCVPLSLPQRWKKKEDTYVDKVLLSHNGEGSMITKVRGLVPISTTCVPSFVPRIGSHQTTKHERKGRRACHCFVYFFYKDATQELDSFWKTMSCYRDT
jgi:hypothetical protein